MTERMYFNADRVVSLAYDNHFMTMRTHLVAYWFTCHVQWTKIVRKADWICLTNLFAVPNMKISKYALTI